MTASKQLRMTWCILAIACFASPVCAQIWEDRPQRLERSPEESARWKSNETRREARVLFGLGLMRYHGDRWLEALDFLEQAAKLDPQSPAPPRALVPLYLSLAREEDALAACRKVMQLDPDDGATAYQLAKLLKNDGQLREAIAALNQASRSKHAGDNLELNYHVLDDLANLEQTAGDYAAAARSFRRLAQYLSDEKPRLLGGDIISTETFVVVLAGAHEKAGDCQLKLDHHKEAIAAYLESRAVFARQSNAELRHMAVRLNWNLAKAAIAQQQWQDAATYLDEYLENGPLDVEPYEKMVLVLRKLGRDSDVLPTLRKHARRLPDAPSILLLYAKELSAVPRGRGEAEALYLRLAERFPSVEVYRGLFRMHQISGDMIEVLNLIDNVFATILSKDEVEPEKRDTAREKGRLMLQVLRSEPALVNSLLPVVFKELRETKRRSLETWRLLAALAARAKQLDKAETLYRRCLELAPDRFKEQSVVSGLLDVLFAEQKYDEVIDLCKDALAGAGKPEAAELVMFHHSLALAYSQKDKFDDALAEIGAVITRTDGDNKVSARCRKAQILAGAGRFDDAVAECENMLKEYTDAGRIKRARYTLSAIYAQKAEPEKSDAQLLKVLEDDPNDPEANNDLGYQWADRSYRLDDAERMIRRAIEVDHLQRRADPEEEPENAAYLDSLGWVLFRKGRNEEAREWLEKACALSLGTEDPTVWDHLGDVYFKLRQFDKAKTAWQAVIRLSAFDKRSRKEGKPEEAQRKLKLIEDQSPDKSATDE